MIFTRIALPDNKIAFVPNDITVVIPDDPELDSEQRSRLAYIPWSDHYLEKIPTQYHDFFMYVLPHLHVRTTDVHTALSVSQLPAVLSHIQEQTNESLIYLAIILHDVGWSEVSPEGVANSLAYSGLTLSAASRAPKQQHVIFGEALAYKLLMAYPAEKLDLTSDDIFTITEMIRRHDHDATWEKDKFGPISLENNLLCDCDRLWSYTHENFWLDTIRKQVKPEEYIDTIDTAIESYFFTQAGKIRARELIAERRKEVADYLAQLDS